MVGKLFDSAGKVIFETLFMLFVLVNVEEAWEFWMIVGMIFLIDMLTPVKKTT